MKQLFCTGLLICISLLSTAQGPAKNIYAEISGPGGFISANYDTRFAKSNKGLGIRVGVGTVFDPYAVGFTLPVGVNYLVGGSKHFLELGAGVSYIHFKDNNQDSWFNFPKENFLAPHGWVGYRYQLPEKGFTFRAGLCQFFTDFNLPVILGVPSLYPALSFGYAF